MKLTVNQNELLGALQKITSIVQKKMTVQILSNVLLVAKNGELSVSATDLEVGIRLVIPAEVSTEGKITISAKHFSEVINELPDRPLQLLKKDNNWVELSSGKSKVNLVGMAADEFPEMPSFEDKEYFAANSKALATMIDKTCFAVSNDVTRYHLNGVYLEKLENGIMRMVATDGHRLSYVDHEVFLNSPDLKKGVLISKKGLAELRKIIDSAEENIQLCIEKGHLFASAPKTQLFMRLLEGEYPDYRQVIPKGADKVAKIDREALISSLRLANLLANEKGRSVKFSLDKNVLQISSSNPEMGEAKEEIEVEYGCEPLEIGFNARYLLDCLPVMDSKIIEIQFKDRLSPGIIQGSEQRNHTYVVMPMRI